MSLLVAPNTVSTILDFADGFVVQVQDPSNVRAAAGALRTLRSEVVQLAGADPGRTEDAVVSEVVVLPAGPLVRFARLGLGTDVLRAIPDRLRRHLEAAGVDSGRIVAPVPGGRLDALDTTASAVVLRLFPEPAGADGVLRPEWLDIACEWVLGDLPPAQPVTLRVLGVELEVPASEAPAVVHQCGAARAWCDLVNGSFTDRVRTASITFGRAPHVALAAGGPGVDSHGLIARFELLADVARELSAEVAYACIDIEPTFEGLGLGLSPVGWRAHGGASPNVVAGELCDVLVPDAYPFQVLGPGHIARLDPDRADPDDPPVGEPLGNGKVEVVIGQLSEWLPIYDTREEVQSSGWEVLKSCLATDSEVEAMLASEPRRAQPRAEREPVPDAVLLSGTPDLDTITLEALPHHRRGLRLTALELASWLAHEPHSDEPASVSRVLATYTRWLASGLDDPTRQELKGRADRLVGTADPATNDARLGPDDTARAWLAADWLVRVQAPAWLRLAALSEAAARLEALGPVTDNLELVRAVDVLGSAITIAGRRIDITTQIAGADRDDDAALVEEASWEAWDRASEMTGWVAASEAASVGVPADLAYATDLRVIECSRDGRVRDELEAARKSVGDTAWATALHAIADEAWQKGWEAADAATSEHTTITLRTAIHRATNAALDRLGIDDDHRESVLESAEAAARDSLTRAALRGGAADAGEHAWDAARRAARSASGGHAWGAVMDIARDALEESSWEVAMTAARDAVSEVLRDAPDMVARTVAASVAREAASAAARGVALRAAAVARAHGGDDGKAFTAAVDALAGTVESLRQAAIELLDRMVDPGARSLREPA